MPTPDLELVISSAAPLASPLQVLGGAPNALVVTVSPSPALALLAQETNGVMAQPHVKRVQPTVKHATRLLANV